MSAAGELSDPVSIASIRNGIGHCKLLVVNLGGIGGLNCHP